MINSLLLGELFFNCFKCANFEYFVSFKQIEDFNKPLFFKYLLYIFIVIFVHFITFVYFPMKGNINSGYELFCIEKGKCNDFTSNKTLIFFYIDSIKF